MPHLLLLIVVVEGQLCAFHFVGVQNIFQAQPFDEHQSGTYILRSYMSDGSLFSKGRLSGQPQAGD